MNIKILALLAPFLLIISGAATVLGLFGVSWWQMLVFAAYEIAFIIVPGCLVYQVANKNSTSLSGYSLSRQFSVGWALGYALEMACFVLTARAGHRELLRFYPLIIIGICCWFLWKERRLFGKKFFDSLQKLDSKTVWSLSICCVISFLFLSLRSFLGTPLALEIERGAAFNPDAIWSLGMAAEAKHQWPMLDPYVSGETLSYYKGVFMHLASASQITGLPLPLVFFRLYALPLYVLLILQLYVIGRAVGISRGAGLLTVCLALFLEEIPAIGFTFKPFNNLFIYYLYSGHTFFFGLIFFLALVIELGARIEKGTFCFSQFGAWIVVAFLLWAAGGSKGTVLPIVLGGLIFLGLWKTASEKKINRALILAFGLTIGVYLIYQKLVYSNIVPQLQWGFFTMKDKMQVVIAIVRRFPLAQAGWALPIYEIGLTLLGLCGLLGVRSLGLWFFWRYCRANRFRLTTQQQWCVCLALGALLPSLAFDLINNGQLWFFYYGYALLCALAAAGLFTLYQHIESSKLQKTAFGFVGLLCLLSLISPARHLVTFGQNQLHHRPSYNQTPDVTPQLLEGLTWIRDNTPPQAIFAASNIYTELSYPYARNIPRYFYYAAFGERRFFLASWSYTSKSMAVGYERVRHGEINPYAERFALNQRLFQHADMSALEIMHRNYNVSFLLVDKIHEPVHPQLAQKLATVARRIYSNSDIDIYQLN